MFNSLQDRQTQLILGAALVFVALAVGVGVVAFQLGQKTASPAQPGPEAQSPASAVAAEPPVIVTNTPTATPPPSPTPSATPRPTATPSPTPSPTPTPIVVINHISALGRLETTEFAMQTVIDLENSPTNVWEQFFGTDKLMLVAEGEVVAGFDLAQVEQADVEVEGRRVVITLPAPEILYSRIDNERTYVYERETGLFVTPDQSLEGRARQLAEERLEAWAIERGIIDRAESSGRVQIENLLRSLGFTEIEIVVEEKEL